MERINSWASYVAAELIDKLQCSKWHNWVKPPVWTDGLPGCWLLKRYPSVGVRSIPQTKPVGSRQLAKRIAARPSTKDGQPSTNRQLQHICWVGATKTLHHCPNRYCCCCCCCCYGWNEKSSTRSAPYNSTEMAALHLFLSVSSVFFVICKFFSIPNTFQTFSREQQINVQFVRWQEHLRHVSDVNMARDRAKSHRPRTGQMETDSTKGR